MQSPLIIITGSDNCANPFWNNTLSTYSWNSIRNDGLYIVSEHVFLWSHVSICKFINYDWWPIIVKSNLFLGFHSWREYVAYPILWKNSEKRVYFGVASGRLLACLPTGLTWSWIIPPGSKFLSCKVSFWHA